MVASSVSRVLSQAKKAVKIYHQFYHVSESDYFLLLSLATIFLLYIAPSYVWTLILKVTKPCTAVKPLYFIQCELDELIKVS